MTLWLDERVIALVWLIVKFLLLFSVNPVVVTSSFHGTAFAVNFGIPLISIVPEGNNDDRQSSLLKSVGLNSCITNLNADIKSISYNYDKNISLKNFSF